MDQNYAALLKISLLEFSLYLEQLKYILYNKDSNCMMVII